MVQVLLQENRRLDLRGSISRPNKCTKKNDIINSPAKRKTKNATRGIRALLVSGIKKQNLAASRVHAIFGNVNNKRLRRPNVSIVQTAGNAKSQFTRPKPQEAKSACCCAYPASEKDSRGVKGDDVDATHLLRDHDEKTGKCSTTNTGNGKEFHKAREIVTPLEYFHLFNKLTMNIV